MKFDPFSKYLALYGKDTVSIIKLDTHDQIPMIELDNYTLDKKYSKILDLHIKSVSEDEDEGYNCEIAVLHSKYQHIDIFDISEPNPQDSEKMISYQNQQIEHMIVKISDDFGKVIFCSK